MILETGRVTKPKHWMNIKILQDNTHVLALMQTKTVSSVNKCCFIQS